MPLDRRFRLLGVRAGHLMRADALPAPGAAPGKEEGQLTLPF